MTTQVPCRAQDPQTCPYHGNLLKAEAALTRADNALSSGDFDGFLTASDEATEFKRLATKEASKSGEVHDFFEKRAANPLKVPTVGSPYQTVNYLPATTRMVPKVVSTQAQLRQAVQDQGGPRGKDTVRQIVAQMSDKQIFRDHKGPKTIIDGPLDGRPIVVELDRCYTDLEVNSGTTLINAHSTYGGGVGVHGSANATIITPPGKLHIDVNDDSRVTIVPRDGARGSIWVGQDAQVEIIDIPGVKHELHINRGDRRSVKV